MDGREPTDADPTATLATPRALVTTRTAKFQSGVWTSPERQCARTRRGEPLAEAGYPTSSASVSSLRKPDSDRSGQYLVHGCITRHVRTQRALAKPRKMTGQNSHAASGKGGTRVRKVANSRKKTKEEKINRIKKSSSIRAPPGLFRASAPLRSSADSQISSPDGFELKRETMVRTTRASVAFPRAVHPRHRSPPEPVTGAESLRETPRRPRRSCCVAIQVERRRAAFRSRPVTGPLTPQRPAGAVGRFIAAFAERVASAAARLRLLAAAPHRPGFKSRTHEHVRPW